MNKRAPLVAGTSAALMTTGFAVLLFIVSVTFKLAEQAQSDLNTAVAARTVAHLAAQLQSGLQAAESSQRGFLVTSNEIYLAPYAAAKTQAMQAQGALIPLLDADPKNGAMTERLSSILAEKIDEMDNTITLKRDGRDAELRLIVRSNRGKALMDEANVFISSVIRTADAGVTEGATRQKEGLFDLRRIILFSAGLIVLVVGTTIGLVIKFGRDLTRARDDVEAVNAALEQRVVERTSELLSARDRAEILLAEVNHRVANSLALVASMVGMQARTATSAETRDALSETQARIFAVALVHKKLYTSGDIHTVALDEFLASLIDQLKLSMESAGHSTSLIVDLDPVKMPTDKSVSLGVITAEWVTNAYKYAYPGRDGEIRVKLKQVDDGMAELVVEDDGVGIGVRPAATGTGLGSKLVAAMATTLGARIEYRERRVGTSASLRLPIA